MHTDEGAAPPLRTRVERSFRELRFNLATFENLVEQVYKVFPDGAELQTELKVNFGNKSGAFGSVDELRAQQDLPETIYDVSFSVSSTAASIGYARVRFDRFSKTRLTVTSANEVWAQGVLVVIGDIAAKHEIEISFPRPSRWQRFLALLRKYNTSFFIGAACANMVFAIVLRSLNIALGATWLVVLTWVFTNFILALLSPSRVTWGDASRYGLTLDIRPIERTELRSDPAVVWSRRNLAAAILIGVILAIISLAAWLHPISQQAAK